VGSGRSGATLLRNLLKRHPSIDICRETRERYRARRWNSAERLPSAAS